MNGLDLDPLASLGAIEGDPLRHADPERVADAATVDALLRCWVRETGRDVPDPGGSLEVDLPATATRLRIPVRHASPTGWHRFGTPRAIGGEPLGTGAVAALLATEIAARGGHRPHAVHGLVARALHSAERVARHVAARREDPRDPGGPCSFLAAEQALIFGHPFHPAAKSRPEASEADLALLSPELRGTLAVHWFAADPEIVATGAAPRAGDPIGTLAALAVGVDVPEGRVALPAHPWQARDLVTRPGIAPHLESGRLVALGPDGGGWHPTSSLRTLAHPERAAMLKLSLGLRITNSRRENLRSELHLGVQVARLLDGIEPSLRAAHPGFAILRDPAWAAVESAIGAAESGLEAIVRDRPFDLAAREPCLAGLIAERPEAERSRLGSIVHALADGGEVEPAAARWVAAFVDRVVAPVLWLHDVHGLGLEAHAQNLLVWLDPAGWPIGGRFRDNQGFYVAVSHADAARRIVPDLGTDVEAIFDDALVADRVVYYLVVNALLGLIGALGAEGTADEHALLAAARGRLSAIAASRPGSLAERVVTAHTLPCKANLLTAADGRDELQGDVATQSIYVDIANPLRAS